MKGQPRISSIYAMGESSTTDPDRVHARVWRWCRDLWLINGTIVAKPRELPEDLREPLVRWADETYGERKRDKQKRR